MKNYRLKKGSIAAAAAAAMLGLTACGAGNVQSPAADSNQVVKVQNVENSVISVSSKEEVKVVPDMAQIVLGVHAEDPDAKVCEDKSVESLENVIEFLRQMGVEETSIQTSGYGMNPVYDWSNGKTLTGYEMDVALTVSDVSLEDVGALISGAVESGANEVQSVSYLSSQFDEKYQEALQLAVEAARVKGEAIANAGGVSLGKVVKVEEITSNTQARYNTAQYAMAVEDEVVRSSSMPVMAGEVAVEANIVVDFEITEGAAN